MPSIASILEILKRELSNITFVEGDDFAWSPLAKEIHYNTSDDIAPARLLHEAGHARLNHQDYSKDITLLEMERDAWQEALNLASLVNVDIDEDTIQSHLDEYRDWLHARSTCPTCEQTGIQNKQSSYSCPACHTSWRVNDARTCQLKRYKITPV